MKTLKRTGIYNSSPDKVFKCIDDLGVTGMHMTKSSMPMMGGKLDWYANRCLKNMLEDSKKSLEGI